MALTNYTELQAAIRAWLNKGTTLDAQIPDFIRLTESRLNKRLRDPDMEVTSTATTSGQYLGLPSDFGSMRSLNVGTYRLSGVSTAGFSGFSNVAGIPRSFGVYDGQLAFAPVPATGSAVTMVYTRTIPPLASNATNWLLDRAPELYLYGALMEAEFFGWNDERLPLIKTRYDEAIDELRHDGEERRWGASPLAPRLGRT